MDIEKIMFMVIVANFTSAASSRLRSLRLVLNIWSTLSKSLTFSKSSAFSKWPRFSLTRFSELVEDEDEVEVDISMVDLASSASLRITGIPVLVNVSMITMKTFTLFLVTIMRKIMVAKCVSVSPYQIRKPGSKSHNGTQTP